ncbi:hypothetical protein RDABS01_040039 [Bienertia sinuspersici]
MRSKIIRKCAGLPMAAKALGSLFRKTTEKSQRQTILDSNIWSEEGHVLPVLKLSYFHLPYHLRYIFAYCSIFPKDYEFKEKEVILLWMAQGFIIPKNQKESMEVTGHHYFLDLLSMSLFEKSPSNKKRYVMHDLVHDMSQWASRDTCRCIMDTEDSHENLTSVRHLTLHKSVTEQPFSINQTLVSQFRTFICRMREYLNGVNLEFQDFILRFRCIRSLRLASETVEGLPECIGDLKHLRYLDLEFTKISELPESIYKLCNLQTLFLGLCRNLRNVRNIRYLVNLRHLRFHQTLWKVMPVGTITKLTDLQTMGKMYLGDDHGDGSIIRALKFINHLQGKLKVIGLQNVKKVEDARAAQLSKKEGLEQLRLKWSGDGHDEIDDNTKSGVLEELKPSSNIKECELDGFMGSTLPSWLGNPSLKNMVDIKLVNCEKCERLPPLGQLFSLKKLWVKGMKVWVGWLQGSKEKFPSLEELIIEQCQSFEGNLPSALPSLKILRIEQCPQASVLLPTSRFLEELKIVNCGAVLPSTGKKATVNSSKRLWFEEIKSGNIDLVVGSSCLDELHITKCDSLVTINKIPAIVGSVRIDECEKLEWVEFDELSTSVATVNDDNFFQSIMIFRCNCIVAVGNIPLTVKRLCICYCDVLESVTCSGKWNLFHSSKAVTFGEGGRLQLSHLNFLDISCCPKFKSLPQDILLPSIEHMRFIDNENQEGFPEQMHCFTSLEVLWIWHCHKIHKFPKGGLPRSLTKVYIRNVKIKEGGIGEWGLDLLPHLQRLRLQEIGDSVECIIGRDMDDDDKDKASHSHSTLYLSSTSLFEFLLIGFKNLKSINCSSFPNLTYLRIENCPSLESLDPNNHLPSKLEDVLILNCPLTHQQCKPCYYGPIKFRINGGWR